MGIVSSCTFLLAPSRLLLTPRHASFGGTDGQYHYNDTWAYDVNTRRWSELQCIGFIPSPREGHAAAVVDDVIYIFGGRGVDGKDLGDLAAFKLSSECSYFGRCDFSCVMSVRGCDLVILTNLGLIILATQTSDGICFKTWVLHQVRGLVMQWLRWEVEFSCSVESRSRLQEEMIMG